MAIGRRSRKDMTADVFVVPKLPVCRSNMTFNEGTFGKKRGGFMNATNALNGLAQILWQKN